METIKTPVGIKIITILVISIYPIVYLFSLNEIESFYLFRLDIPAILISVTTLVTLFLFFVFLGITLWKGKNYSRIMIIILSVLAPFLKIILHKLFIPQIAYDQIQALPTGTPFFTSIIIYIFIAIPFYLIASYLLFSKKVKVFFNNIAMVNL